MKKLLLLSSFLYFTSVASPTLATDCTTVHSCTSLGYVDITSASCDDGVFIKCPVDANYGICVKNPFGKLTFPSNVTDIDCANPPTCSSLGYVDITSASCDDGTLIKCPLDANYGFCIANHYEEDPEEPEEPEEPPAFNCEITSSGVIPNSIWNTNEVTANNPCSRVGGDGGLCMYNDDVAEASGLTTGQIVFLSDTAGRASTYKVFNTVNSTASTTVNAGTMVYYACLMTAGETPGTDPNPEPDPENITRPLAECEPGDFLIMPMGSSAFCSTTDITGTNYKVLDVDKTHVFYTPVTADNVNYVPQTPIYQTKAHMLSAIKVAHPGCYILPNTAVLADYRIYRDFLTEHEIITDDRSDYAILFANNSVTPIPIYYNSRYPQVYICANALRISTGNPSDIPSPDWNLSAGDETWTCPPDFQFTCAPGYTHETPDEYCINDGSNIRYYRTPCNIPPTCKSQGYTFTCSYGTTNSDDDYCEENGVKYYQTACHPLCGSGEYLHPMSCCASAQSGIISKSKATDGVSWCYKCCTKNDRSSVVPPSSDPCDKDGDGQVDDLPECCGYPAGCGGIWFPPGSGGIGGGGAGVGEPSQLDRLLEMLEDDSTLDNCELLGCTVFY